MRDTHCVLADFQVIFVQQNSERKGAAPTVYQAKAEQPIRVGCALLLVLKYLSQSCRDSQ